MQTKFLKPAADLKVRKPDGRHLNPEGEPVELNSYWLRRIDDGDVVETAPPKPAKINKE